MKQQVQKALYSLHSWSGLATGLLIYVLSLSGVVALFHGELGPWQRGSEPAPPATLAGVDAVLARQGSLPEDVTVLLPTDDRPWAIVEMGHESGDVLHVDAATGQPLADPGHAILDLVVRLHTDLLLPAPFGRYLVGFLGVVMLLLVISGIFLHRKFLREFFVLRLRRSSRLRWTDLHKSVGLWALPFHFIMSFTGAVLGMLGFILLLAGLIAYKGDIDAAQSAMFPVPAEASGETANMLPLDTLTRLAIERIPGMSPEVVTLHHYGDRLAEVTVYGNVAGKLVYFPAVALAGHSGETLEVIDWSEQSWVRQTYALVTPLHYGSFGGLLVKALYTLLGAGSCLLVISGLRIWLARPLVDAARRPRLVWWLMEGVISGLPFALVGLLLAGRVYPDLNLSAAMTLCGFLGLWFLAFIWTTVRPRGVAGRELVLGTGILLVSLALGGWLFASPWGGPWLNTVRALALLIGLMCLWGAGKARRAA
ncbi:MAG: PepSY-associated TM helix domain-containing protein [Pseudomonadota bacterium]|nr:PepSY-associated TM helix domain-containing protein [Pseudomonadota bacterium]